jgi:Flp pilus assembly protein TadD
METTPQKQLARDPFIELLSHSGDVHIEEKPATDGRQFVVTIPKFKLVADAAAITPNESHSKEYLLENASILLGNGEFVLARNLYSFLLKQDLRNEEALMGLGVCLLRTGDVSAARRCFTALWELYKKESSLLKLAQCAIADKDDKEALNFLSRIKSPSFLSKIDRYEFYKETGNCLTRNGEFSPAERAYTEALNLYPTNDATYVNLGTLEIQRERFDLALFYFRKALQLNASNPRAHCGIGITAVAVNDLERAKTAFLKALEFDASNVVALHQLAGLCEVLTIDAEVIERIENYLKTQPKNNELRFTLAALRYKHNEWTQAERELDTILKADSGHEKARRLKQELTQNRHR